MGGGPMKPFSDNERRSWSQRIAVGELSLLSKLPFVFLGAILTFSAISLQNESKLLSSLFNMSNGKMARLRIPSDLDPESARRLSLNLGGGACEWQPPAYDVPEDIPFYKTAIVGFPSGDKRMVFIQMESLTGWPAKDEWDFEYLGDSNHPFIKANYPHHEGIWGWGTNADQVVLVVKNIRKSMVEYHDILWDIGYAKTWADAMVNKDTIYGERPPLDDFHQWRDLRVMDEISWYGWFIDWWMEGGLLRDVYTHKITTPEHIAMLMQPHNFQRSELDYDLVVGADTIVTPTYDPHCANNEVTAGCQPVAIVSAEKLLDYSEGPKETTAIANVLLNHDGMAPYVIEPEAWDCIWNELIVNKKGARTILDRPNTNYTADDYNFSIEMLEEMIKELDRLLSKYSSSEWSSNDNANRLVQLFTEHKASLLTEMHEVNSGVRRLKENDFLSPGERQALNLKHGGADERQFNLEYFSEMERAHAFWKLSRVNGNLVDLTSN